MTEARDHSRIAARRLRWAGASALKLAVEVDQGRAGLDAARELRALAARAQDLAAIFDERPYGATETGADP